MFNCSLIMIVELSKIQNEISFNAFLNGMDKEVLIRDSPVLLFLLDFSSMTILPNVYYLNMFSYKPFFYLDLIPHNILCR